MERRARWRCGRRCLLENSHEQRGLGQLHPAAEGFSGKSYSVGKLGVSSAAGMMDLCLSVGSVNGKKYQASEGYRVYPSDPKGQGKSLKQFCDVQTDTGGHVNLMTYDFFSN